MGTSNFLYNHKLDVSSGTLFSSFDLEAYNKEMDDVDRLKADDYETIGNILHWNCEDAIDDIRYRADEPYQERDPWRKYRIEGVRILSTTDASEDKGEYMTRCFGGTRIATLMAETLFLGCQYLHGVECHPTFRVLRRQQYRPGIPYLYRIQKLQHC